jgi:hypothetical protein
VNEEPGSIEVKRVRTGSCHRCGWKSAVERVTRHERRQFKTTLKYRWLCTECVGELALRRRWEGHAETAGGTRPQGGLNLFALPVSLLPARDRVAKRPFGASPGEMRDILG